MSNGLTIDLRPGRVLIFEDTENDQKRLVDALKEGIPNMELVVFTSPPEITNLWMRKGPDSDRVEPWEKEIAKYDGMRRRYIKVDPDRQPNVITPGNTFRERENRECYWPEDFGAAVVDIHTEAGTPGDDIAEWLNDARFQGPVVLTTVDDMATGIYHNLPWLMRIKKDETAGRDSVESGAEGTENDAFEPEWPTKIVKYIVGRCLDLRTYFPRKKGSRPGAMLSWGGGPSAGLKGRRPGLGAEIERYRKAVLEARQRNSMAPAQVTRPTMHAFWLGSDDTARHHIIGEFGHELIDKRLAGDAPDIGRTWSDSILTHLKEACYSGEWRRPDIIWVEVGEVLRDAHIGQVEKFFETLDSWAKTHEEKLQELHPDTETAKRIRKAADAEEWNPRVALLVERLDRIPQEAAQRLMYHGALALDCNILLDGKDEWMARAVHQFVTRRRAWEFVSACEDALQNVHHKKGSEMTAEEKSTFQSTLKRIDAFEEFRYESLCDVFLAYLTLRLLVPADSYLKKPDRDNPVPLLQEWLGYDPADARDQFRGLEHHLRAPEPNRATKPRWIPLLVEGSRISERLARSLGYKEE